MILFKVTMLILVINGIPPVLAVALPAVAKQPVDGGRRFRDGRVLCGKHKTVRGFVGGVLAGGILGYLIGLSLFVGLLAGLLSMLGDLFSSFIKRRLGLPEGANVPVLDHFFEGAFPLLLFQATYAVPWAPTLGSLLFFLVIAQGSAVLFRKVTSSPEVETGRLVRSSSYFRYWRACHTALSPLARYLNFENVLYYRLFMKGVFKCLGIYGAAHK